MTHCVAHGNSPHRFSVLEPYPPRRKIDRAFPPIIRALSSLLAAHASVLADANVRAGQSVQTPRFDSDGTPKPPADTHPSANPIAAFVDSTTVPTRGLTAAAAAAAVVAVAGSDEGARRMAHNTVVASRRAAAAHAASQQHQHTSRTTRPHSHRPAVVPPLRMPPRGDGSGDGHSGSGSAGRSQSWSNRNTAARGGGRAQTSRGPSAAPAPPAEQRPSTTRGGAQTAHSSSSRAVHPASSQSPPTAGPRRVHTAMDVRSATSGGLCRPYGRPAQQQQHQQHQQHQHRRRYRQRHPHPTGESAPTNTGRGTFSQTTPATLDGPLPSPVVPLAQAGGNSEGEGGDDVGGRSADSGTGHGRGRGRGRGREPRRFRRGDATEPAAPDAGTAAAILEEAAAFARGRRLRGTSRGRSSGRSSDEAERDSALGPRVRQQQQQQEQRQRKLERVYVNDPPAKDLPTALRQYNSTTGATGAAWTHQRSTTTPRPRAPQSPHRTGRGGAGGKASRREGASSQPPRRPHTSMGAQGRRHTPVPTVVTSNRNRQQRQQQQQHRSVSSRSPRPRTFIAPEPPKTPEWEGAPEDNPVDRFLAWTKRNPNVFKSPTSDDEEHSGARRAHTRQNPFTTSGPQAPSAPPPFDATPGSRAGSEWQRPASLTTNAADEQRDPEAADLTFQPRRIATSKTYRHMGRPGLSQARLDTAADAEVRGVAAGGTWDAAAFAAASPGAAPMRSSFIPPHIRSHQARMAAEEAALRAKPLPTVVRDRERLRSSGSNGNSNTTSSATTTTRSSRQPERPRGAASARRNTEAAEQVGNDQTSGRRTRRPSRPEDMRPRPPRRPAFMKAFHKRSRRGGAGAGVVVLGMQQAFG